MASGLVRTVSVRSSLSWVVVFSSDTAVSAIGLPCEYMRERKKRGKVSRKDLQHQQVTTATSTQVPEPAINLMLERHSAMGRPSSPGDLSPESAFMMNGMPMEHTPSSVKGYRPTSNGSSLSGGSEVHSNADALLGVDNFGATYDSSQSIGGIRHLRSTSGRAWDWASANDEAGSTRAGSFSCSTDIGAGDPETSPDRQKPAYHPVERLRINDKDGSQIFECSELCSDSLASPTGSFHFYSPHRQDGYCLTASPTEIHTPALSLQDSALGAWSPACLSLPSPAPSSSQHHSQQFEDSTLSLRYPVLLPLVPYLKAILSNFQACDLLETYFTEAARVNVHPLSPYLISYAFRKDTFLYQPGPRPYSPALLASMLWIAARAREKGSQPSLGNDWEQVCQRLLELTLRLLRPRIRDPLSRERYEPSTASTTASPTEENLHWQEATPCSGAPGPHASGPEHLNLSTGATDDVATLINLAVISAIECPSKSLQWWNAAWTLARKQRLNYEIPYGAMISQESWKMADYSESGMGCEGKSGVYLRPPYGGQLNSMVGRTTSHAILTQGGNSPQSTLRHVTEEDREERRRLWWLLYILDRHLALCCDRPLALLESECANLLEPTDEARWQAGDFDLGRQHSGLPDTRLSRRRWDSCAAENTEHTIFAYFLPLMSAIEDTLQLQTPRGQPLSGGHLGYAQN